MKKTQFITGVELTGSVFLVALRRSLFSLFIYCLVIFLDDQYKCNPLFCLFGTLPICLVYFYFINSLDSKRMIIIIIPRIALLFLVIYLFFCIVNIFF